MSNWFGFFAMFTALPLLMLLVKAAAKKWNLSAEVKRKLVHMGMGLATLAFPWIFTHWGFVAALSATSITFLILQKRMGGGDVLHSVNRDSLGEVWFAIAIPIVFWWAGGEAYRFIIPMLVLTLADAAGALFGTGYGKSKFQVLSGWKSLEGSTLFFVIAFLSAHVPLLLMSDTGRAECLMVAFALALVAMLIEAVSTRGIDNVVVPVACAYLLDVYLDLSMLQLTLRIALVVGLLGLVLLTRRFSTLEGGALMAAVLLGYGCAALADWRFLIPPIIMFIEHLVVTHRIKIVGEPRHNLFAILSIAFGLLPWLIWARLAPEMTDIMLGVFITAVAIHLAVMNLTTRSYIAKRRVTKRMYWKSVSKGAFLLTLPCFALIDIHWTSLAWGLVSCVATAAAVGAFILIHRHPEEYTVCLRRWASQGLVALLGSSILLLQFL